MTQDTTEQSYTTKGGVGVTRHREPLDPEEARRAIAGLQRTLDGRRGVVLTSGYEYPGRYSRWDVGFCDPPLSLQTRSGELQVEALNDRGALLLDACRAALEACAEVARVEAHGTGLFVSLREAQAPLPEELRTRRPGPLSAVRALRELFFSEREPHLGLYGAFGYDLVFSLEDLPRRMAREPDQRDLVLYLPDALVVVDHQRGHAERLRYDFEHRGRSTRGLPRDGAHAPYGGARSVTGACDHPPGGFAAVVRAARERFARGDLFEVTPSQVFRRPCTRPPSELFARLREENPAPYGFLLNLGEGEYLVGASPEMYVRVQGRRVETCPIAGTIARGADALGDAEQIRKLLSSDKDESELTMCTDVDRNDKARVCEPGSVRVIGRRQVELYSRLIHTVDHVEGTLRPGYDGLDALLTHLWAVTVTGAPKLAAMRFIEAHERSPRRFYGGAVGVVGFDGHVNTGLTLRTIRVARGVAEVRAGATLLFESDPAEEAAESELKASALLSVLDRPAGSPAVAAPALRPGTGKRLLLVDHEDSFVHTLADYFRQTGAEVITLRHGFDVTELDRLAPDAVVLSPGPGRPADFATSALLSALLARGLPVFGVCLGLQALVEHFGGKLAQLQRPAHGKPARVRVLGGRLFAGLPRELTVGRYHSLHAARQRLPASLRVTAQTPDGLVMAVEHAQLPLSAVQFHPESILSAGGGLGLTLIRNAVAI
ncbi:MAG: anthranilate synthase component I [Myxococcales bacterium]|jgi:anthranilate synthase